MLARCIIKRLSHAGLMSHSETKILLILIPVCYVVTCHTRLNRSLGNSCRHLCYKARVDWFRNKVCWTESEVVYLINIIHHVWHWLLSQISYGMHCCELHLLIDGLCMHIKRSTENIRETYYVVNLIRIVRTARRHQYIRTACHCIFVSNFWSRISKSENNRLVSHRAYHILAYNISF